MNKDKKEALSKFHRNQIVCAAEKLFSEKGVLNTTVDDIAVLAQYSKATIYVYFKNKNEIINAIILKGMKILYEKIYFEIDKNCNWIETYFLICHAITDFYDKSPVTYDAVVGKINVNLDDPSTPLIFYEIFETGEQINKKLVDFMERGIKNKIIKPQESILKTLFILWSGISGIIKMSIQKKEYIKNYLKVERNDFLESGYKALLDSILLER